MSTHNGEALLMSTHNMFLWRTGENYPIIITKYSLIIPLLKGENCKVFQLEHLCKVSAKWFLLGYFNMFLMTYIQPGIGLHLISFLCAYHNLMLLLHFLNDLTDSYI